MYLTRLVPLLLLLSLSIRAIADVSRQPLKPKKEVPDVSVEKWKKPLPYNSPLVESKKGSTLSLQGSLAMITSLPTTKDRYANYFLCLFSYSGSIAKAQKQAIYHLKRTGPDHFFDPQFSPDGTKVLFKYGWQYDINATFQLYILNLENGKLSSVDRQLKTFPIAKWSPDGRYILFVSGGDVLGNDSNSYYPRTLYTYDIANHTSYEIDSSPRSTYYFWTKDDTGVYLKGDKVYESSANGFKHQKILNYAETLAVSPDGNYLLYEGYKDKKNETNAIKAINAMSANIRPGVNAPEVIIPPHFCIYDRKAKQKYFFDQNLQHAQFIWMKQRNKLVALTSTVDGGGGVVTVNLVDLPSGNIHQITKLTQLEGIQGAANTLYLQTRPIAITKDNTNVIVLRVQQNPKAKPGFEHKAFLIAVSLVNGKQRIISEDAYQTWPITGIDWN